MKSILFVAIQALVRACLLDSVSYSLACLDPIITRKKLNIIWSFEPDPHCNSTDQFVGQTGFFLAFSYSPQVCTKVHKIVYIAQRVHKSCLLHKIVSIAQRVHKSCLLHISCLSHKGAQYRLPLLHKGAEYRLSLLHKGAQYCLSLSSVHKGAAALSPAQRCTNLTVTAQRQTLVNK